MSGRELPGFMWGHRKENGIWFAVTPRRRFMTPWSPPGHDSFFIAIGRLRMRLVVRDIHDERDYELKRTDEQTVLL